MRQIVRALFASTALCLAVPAMAQDAAGDAEPQAAEPGSDDFHSIYVTAAGVDRLDVVAGTSVVTGMELQRESSGQIGDILSEVPGVAATGFSPGASRPVLRGLGGERVRVLTDGISSFDVSGNSADHAVSVDPLIAERIEVLRGPAVLLYGNQAIGGAVNVITKRIPPRIPEEPFHVDLLAGFDTVADARELGFSFDAPFGNNFAWHLDASWRETEDLEIPGFAASPSLRADLLADAAEEEEEGHLDEAAELREAASIRDVLPNSYTETWSAGTGFAWHSGQNTIGFSADIYDTEYGVPGLPGIGHVHEEEEDLVDAEEHGGEEEEAPVSIGLRRYRADFNAAFDLGESLFDTIQTRWGYSDYTHTEFEGDEVGTVFAVEGVEGRLELVQNRRGGWGGSVGAQVTHTDFAALGDEAYIPPNVTDNIAVFALQELALAAFEVEAGLRYEHAAIDATTLGISRDYDTISGAIGGSYTIVDDFRIGANLSRAERAPTAQELFANGPHIATQQFEVGNDALGKESSLGAEAYLRGELGPVKINMSLYRNWFDDFIYLSARGEDEDGLPVFDYLQQDADQWGAEGQVTFDIISGQAFELLADLRGEYTRATLDDGSPVPRIPPLSLYGALEGRWDHFDVRGEVEWFDAQDRVGEFETPTDSFTMVNASVAWHPLEGSDNITFIASLDNIFDVEGRNAASFTRDFVPMPGRNFKLTARASF